MGPPEPCPRVLAEGRWGLALHGWVSPESFPGVTPCSLEQPRQLRLCFTVTFICWGVTQQR